MRPVQILPPPAEPRRRRRRSWLLGLLTFVFASGVLLFLGGIAVAGFYVWMASRDLPDYERLAKYEPPVMTRIHAADGTLMAEYARERRIFVPINVIPAAVIQAFLSAEDRRFYEHGGLDFVGIARALYKNVQNKGRRAEGASTITQQVAKNLLLTSERTFDRKLKEAILAIRMERTFKKEQILELYLNEIYLGMNSYGVAAAALNYFGKELAELNVEEAAYLAALPKAPNNYHPFKKVKEATERRNWILDQMAENGFITPEEARAAKAKELKVNIRPFGTQIYAADYFAEEVRRQLVQMYGEDGLYGRPERTGGSGEDESKVNGGLSVRTTLDPRLQKIGRRVLIDGLVAFDRGQGWRGRRQAHRHRRRLGAGAERDRDPDRSGAVAARRRAAGGPREGHRRAASAAPRGRQAGPRAGGAGHSLRGGQVGQGCRQQGRAQGGDGRAQPRRRDLGGAQESRPAHRRLVAHADPRGRRRPGRPGPAYRTRARGGRRLLVRAEPVRPRPAGQAAARLVLQAVRLRRRARQRLQADQHRARRARSRSTRAPARRSGRPRTTTAPSPTGRPPCAWASKSRATR